MKKFQKNLLTSKRKSAIIKAQKGKQSDESIKASASHSAMTKKSGRGRYADADRVRKSGGIGHPPLPEKK